MPNTITPPRGTRWREVPFMNIHGEEYVAKFCNGTWFDCSRSIDGSWTERSSFSKLLVSDADTELVWGLRATPTEPIPAPVVVRDAVWIGVHDLVLHTWETSRTMLKEVVAWEGSATITDRIVALLRGEKAIHEPNPTLSALVNRWYEEGVSPQKTYQQVDELCDRIRTAFPQIDTQPTAAQCLARLQELGWTTTVVRKSPGETFQWVAEGTDDRTRETGKHHGVPVHRALVAPTPEGE